MSDLGDRIAGEAEELIGCPFRLQGRDPRTGLDCVGLVALALMRARGGEAVPTPQAYRLRNSELDQFLPFAERAGLQPVEDEFRRGDILHTSPGAAQNHLLVTIGSDCFVHAHAGLRRVVTLKAKITDPVLHHWRAAPQ